MSQDQRFEYTTVKIVWGDFEDEAEDKFNEMAEDGWQLVETAEVNSHTGYYIFERPVE
ncbi:DUF4177 domain protein [Halobacterium phage phiH]|uniref:DUF4177 domain protein n=1 Tax=Halobacterium phage phiH TaxID=169684 RepID=A0A3G1ZKP5_BPPHH|nr:DUF4177 domain protein [Halobacterium phage phiH]AYM00266.1 DUF4177 domain protein [Halobacterium phage phiH]